MNYKPVLQSIVSACVALVVAQGSAVAQTPDPVADFYRGKQLRIIPN